MSGRTYKILWGAFLFLLVVLLPHTAWYFGQAEDTRVYMIGGYAVQLGKVTAWAAAAAFESAVAIFTHLLAKHIEAVKVRGLTWWQKGWRQYGNVYTVALGAALLVSISANYKHAFVFSKDVYVAITTGGILPVCSFLFARALANRTESEHEPDEVDREANIKLKEANRRVRELSEDVRRMEGEVNRRVQELTEVVRQKDEELNRLNDYRTVFDGSADAAERIRRAVVLWPDVSQNALSQVLNISKSYVNDVVRQNGFHKEEV